MQTITDEMLAKGAVFTAPDTRGGIQVEVSREHKVAVGLVVAAYVMAFVVTGAFGVSYVPAHASETSPIAKGIVLWVLLSLVVGVFVSVGAYMLVAGYYYKKQFKRGIIHAHSTGIWEKLRVWLFDSFNIQLEQMSRDRYLAWLMFLIRDNQSTFAFNDVDGRTFVLRKVEGSDLDYVVVLESEVTFDGKNLPQVVNAVAHTVLTEGFRIDAEGRVRVGDSFVGATKAEVGAGEKCPFSVLIALGEQEDSIIPKSIRDRVVNFVLRADVLDACATNKSERASFARIHEELDELAKVALMLTPVGFDEESEAKIVDGLMFLTGALDNVISSYTDSVKTDLDNVVAVQKVIFGAEESNVEDDVSDKDSVTS